MAIPNAVTFGLPLNEGRHHYRLLRQIEVSILIATPQEYKPDNWDLSLSLTQIPGVLVARPRQLQLR